MKKSLILLPMLAAFTLYGADEISTHVAPKVEECLLTKNDSFVKMRSLWSQNKGKKKSCWADYRAYEAYYLQTFKYLLKQSCAENQWFVDAINKEDQDLALLFPIIADADARDLMRNDVVLNFIVTFLMELQFQRPLKEFENQMIETRCEKCIYDLKNILDGEVSKKVGETNDPGDMLYSKYQTAIHNKMTELLKEIGKSIYVNVETVFFSPYTNKRSSITYRFLPFHNAVH